MANFCSNCGAEFTEDSKFCSQCGMQIKNQLTPLDKIDNLLNDSRYTEDVFILISGERYGTTRKRKVLDRLIQENVITEIEKMHYYNQYIEPYMHPDYSVPNFMEDSANIPEVTCPRCGSISITTANKKLSVKRGVVGAVLGTAVPGVGNAIGAAAGAVAGGLSSKKIYNVCMNCGHRWKP